MPVLPEITFEYLEKAIQLGGKVSVALQIVITCHHSH